MPILSGLMSPRMPPALDFLEQAYVRAVATSRVGFVVIAENAKIFARCRRADSINSKNDQRRLERAARDVAVDQRTLSR